MCGKERGQIFRHCGVGGIGETKLLKPRGRGHRSGIERDFRKKPFRENRLDFTPIDRNLDRAANQFRATSGQGERPFIRSVFSHQHFLELTTATDQDTPLPRFQLTARLQPLFEMMSQGQIEIVTPQNQVFAHGDTMKLDDPVPTALHADQRKVGGSTADIADQDILAGSDKLVPGL